MTNVRTKIVYINKKHKNQTQILTTALDITVKSVQNESF